VASSSNSVAVRSIPRFSDAGLHAPLVERHLAHADEVAAFGRRIDAAEDRAHARDQAPSG